MVFLRSLIVFLLFCAVLLWGSVGFALEREQYAFDDIRSYNIVWDSPSKDHSGSMPLGNGDISLNVWVEESGDLCFYIGKTDAWSDNARLLKVGKVRVSLEPNPLKAGARFQQTLDLRNGEIVVTIQPGEGDTQTLTTLRIWVDANNPVIHVTVDAAQRLAATARIELWRAERSELSSIEVSDVYLDRSKPDSKHAPTIVEPDTILKDQGNCIGWYHHNVKSVGPKLTMEIQGLSDYPLDDPLRDRTFGTVIKAQRGRRVDAVTLTTAESKSQRFSIYVLTEQPATGEQWLESMDKMIERIENEDFKARRMAHERWWSQFWDRSWIYIKPASDKQAVSMIAQNTHPVRIGADQSGGSVFQGGIARASVFNRALSETEIVNLSKAGKETLKSDGVLGSWLNVSAGQVVESIKHEDMAGSVTLEAWVKPEAMSQSGGRIIDKITPGASDGILFDTWPGNSLRLITKTGILAEKDCLEPGKWHHVAATVDVADGEQKIFLDGRKIVEQKVNAEDDATCVTRGYNLQRFISACAGRGRYPIKFNGSIFTVPSAGAPGEADYRRWGPGYWWQNSRLPYISMCTSGDFDLMRPLFRMYAEEILPVSVYRVKKYFGHDGAYIPECLYFWGAVFSETYGWQPAQQREDKLQESGWHKWEWVSGPELVFMMLDYYEHTGDRDFLSKTLLSTAHEILSFFDQHYATGDDGKLIMHPSQALETWWQCTNPMPELAGLHAVVDRLLDLPQRVTTAQQREFWTSLKSKLPDLPLREVDGVKMLAPAQKFENKSNIENPELYAVFPFRLFDFKSDDVSLAVEALNHRWDKGNFGWRQDDIFMAYLGLTDQAKQYLIGRARRKDENSRFDAFWGPNYDWVPDQDHGGILLKALQSMLMQTDGKKIYLLPAWPKDWNASFKLHAPHKTIVQGTVKNGKITNLNVTPSTRRSDVEVIMAAD